MPRKRKPKQLLKQLLKKTKPRLFLPTVEAYEKKVGNKLEQFDKKDWDYICKYVPLSERTISENTTKVYWQHISRFQHLSTRFIERFNMFLNLEVISRHQRLNEDFYLRHRGEVDWKFILRYKKISHKTLVLLVGHNFKDEFIRNLFLQQLKADTK